MSRDRILARLKEVRIPLLLLCAGLLLVLSGGRGSLKEQTSENDMGDVLSTQLLEESEKRLAALLQEIDGVGEVHVLLSCVTTPETEYVSDGGETVVLSAGSGKESALSKYTRYPNYLGAVVVCHGADQAEVRLQVMEATAQFTGLGADRITVLRLRD